jgi:uncharacterized protein HemY
MSAVDFTVLEKRVKEFPDNELFRFSLGKAYFDSDMNSEAIQHLEIALQKKSDWMVVAILLGKAWLRLDDKTKAKQYFQLGQKLALEQNHEGPLEETTALLSSLETK